MEALAKKTNIGTVSLNRERHSLHLTVKALAMWRHSVFVQPITDAE
jgi:hypothetical protein